MPGHLSREEVCVGEVGGRLVGQASATPHGKQTSSSTRAFFHRCGVPGRCGRQQQEGGEIASSTIIYTVGANHIISSATVTATSSTHLIIFVLTLTIRWLAWCVASRCTASVRCGVSDICPNPNSRCWGERDANGISAPHWLLAVLWAGHLPVRVATQDGLPSSQWRGHPGLCIGCLGLFP